MSHVLRLAFAVVAVLAPMSAASGEELDPSDPKSGCVMREYPLAEAPAYKDTFYPFVDVRLITNASGGWLTVHVPLDALSVEFRSDGGAHTSLRYYDKTSSCCSGTFEEGCKKAIILVPVKEDVAAWQNEVARWKKVRQDYLDSLPKPRRILPKKD